MLAFVEGTLEFVEGDRAVVNCNGVGYEVLVSERTINSLPAEGTQVRLYTYLNVNENSGVTLCGFLTRDELSFFKLLITVNSVGPKAALSILSVYDTDTLRFAILSDDTKTIAKAPGIGAKTAGKIILDLKDKISLMEAFEKKLENVANTENETLEAAKEDAVLALTALGYQRTESLKAVKQVKVDENSTSDSILKAALKYLL